MNINMRLLAVLTIIILAATMAYLEHAYASDSFTVDMPPTPSATCEIKQWMVMVDDKILLCSQDQYCNVVCF